MAGNDTSALCSDPKYVFQSFDSLAHCYETYGDTPGANFTHVVETCLNDYCKSRYPDLGGCGNWHGPASLPFSINTQGNQYFWNNATCSGVSEGLNSDIGGPGVFVSYLMQLGIIFYFWILLRSFRLFPAISALFNRRKRHCKSPPTNQSKSNILSRIRHYITQNDLVTKVVLVEFQEAQCFFMLASQAAILLAKKSNSIFDSYTIRSVWANNGIAGIVSSAGVLPVVMGMWSLQKMHMMEAWIFFLSVATIIVSEFSLYWTHETPSLDQLVPMDYNGWPDSCGGYAPPLIYCADPTEFYDERVPLLFVWQVLNPYCLTVFGLAVIAWFQPYIVKMVDVRGFCERGLVHLGLPNFSSQGSTPARFDLGWWLRRVLNLLTFAVESLFLAAVLMEAVCFAEFQHLHLIDFSAWGFGQVVAITIWFPVVSKYAYLMLFGIESYSHSRIPESTKAGADGDRTENDANDVELPAHLSSNLIIHKA